MIVLDLSILNQKGTPMFNSDLTANRPAAGIVGRIFIAIDSPYGIFRDTGLAWDQISAGGSAGIGGSGAATQVAFWNGTSSVSGSNNLYWDATNNNLGIQTNTPGNPLDVHGTISSIAALNQLTPTNNTLLSLLNSGTPLWRIGNFYTGGSNDFGVFDVVSATQQFTILNTTGQTFIGAKTTAAGRLVVNSATADAHLQIVGANSPSIRIDNSGSGGTQRFVFGLATATNNFIQGATAGEFCISTQSAGNMLFGMWQTTNASEVMRITTSNNLLVGSGVDTGEKVQITGTAKVTSTLTANSFVKSGGTSAQILAADGSVITAGTNITISGGTISSSGGGGGSMAIGGSITGATAGSILFAGTSGVLAQNNANFFWDNTNFRLGIGTTTPSEKIHIVGNLLISNGSQTTTFSNKKGASNNGLNIWIGNGGVNTSGTGAEGSDNISMGRDALLNLSTGFKSIAIGNQALQNLTNAGNNIAIGYQTLLRITSGSSNVSIGGSSGSNITTAEDNTILGHSAMTNSNSNGNVAIGKFALNSTNGDFNTAVGYLSLFVSTGTLNTSVGTSSLRYNSSGNNNTAIGMNAGVSPGIGSNTTGSNNIFIGYQSYGASSTDSNRTWIGNTSTTSSWLGGNLLLGSQTDNGFRFQCTGTLRIDTQRSATAGGASGQHLIINCDGVSYKIALLNP